MPIRKPAAKEVAGSILTPLMQGCGEPPSDTLIEIAASLIISAVDRDETAQLCERIEAHEAEEERRRTHPREYQPLPPGAIIT